MRVPVLGADPPERFEPSLGLAVLGTCSESDRPDESL